MFHFRSKPTGPVYGVLLDISSGSVGVAVVASYPDNKLPIVLYAHRTTMRITENAIGSSESLRRVREALFSATLILNQEGMSALKGHEPKASISRLFVTCSSPWAFTIARDVHYENEEAFKITQDMLDDLVQSAETEIIKHVREESPLGKEGFEVVERATVDVTVNDYPIHNPLNLKGTELGLSHIAGLVPKEILSFLHEVQDKLLPGTELRAHTFMLVMYCVLRDIFPRMRSYCIIDVTAEATEFGIVENNLLIENSSIPYGTNTLVRSIMNATNKPASDIISNLETYRDKTILDSSDFKESIDEYKAKVGEAINDILGRRMIADDIIITVQKTFEPLFKDLVIEAIHETAGKKVDGLTIDTSLIQEISHGTTDDVYLVINARFFHKLHGCGEIDTH